MMRRDTRRRTETGRETERGKSAPMLSRKDALRKSRDERYDGTKCGSSASMILSEEDDVREMYGRCMGDGSRRVFFFLMDHEHREETPILRKCQEFSRELLAFATTAARARVRGSVTFLLGCGARSIALFARVFLTIYFDAGGDDNGDGGDNATFRGEDERERGHSTARRDERDARAYRYYADRPTAGIAAEVSRWRRRLTYDCRHLAETSRPAASFEVTSSANNLSACTMIKINYSRRN